jgi:hypothetical protein
MARFDLSSAVLILGKIDVRHLAPLDDENWHALREWYRELREK